MKPHTDNRSSLRLEEIKSKINLSDEITFNPDLIEIKYWINGHEKHIIRDTPLTIAEFLKAHYLISEYETTVDGIVLKEPHIRCKIDRQGWDYHVIEHVPIKGFPALPTTDRFEAMAAQHEYDFGKVIPMNPTTHTKKSA